MLHASEVLKTAKSIGTRIIQIVTGLFFLFIGLTLIVAGFMWVAKFWQGRFDRACVRQYPKAESIDECLHNSKL